MKNNYVEVKTWQEYERLTGCMLGDGAKRVFGKCTENDFCYEFEYNQKNIGKNKKYIIAKTEKEAKEKLKNSVAYADRDCFRITKIKLIKKEVAFNSIHVGDWFKGRIYN